MSDGISRRRRTLEMELPGRKEKRKTIRVEDGCSRGRLDNRRGNEEHR